MYYEWWKCSNLPHLDMFFSWVRLSRERVPQSGSAVPLPLWRAEELFITQWFIRCPSLKGQLLSASSKEQPQLLSLLTWTWVHHLMSSKPVFRTPVWHAFWGILILSWDNLLGKVEGSKTRRAEVQLHSLRVEKGPRGSLPGLPKLSGDLWHQVSASFVLGISGKLLRSPSEISHLVATPRCHLGLSGPSGGKWLLVHL